MRAGKPEERKPAEEPARESSLAEDFAANAAAAGICAGAGGAASGLPWGIIGPAITLACSWAIDGERIKKIWKNTGKQIWGNIADEITSFPIREAGRDADVVPERLWPFTDGPVFLENASPLPAGSSLPTAAARSGLTLPNNDANNRPLEIEAIPAAGASAKETLEINLRNLGLEASAAKRALPEGEAESAQLNQYLAESKKLESLFLADQADRKKQEKIDSVQRGIDGLNRAADHFDLPALHTVAHTIQFGLEVYKTIDEFNKISEATSIFGKLFAGFGTIGMGLGAISLLVSLFGTQPDPVMEKLKSMDRKLDHLIEKQHDMMQMLHDLRADLRENFQRVAADLHYLKYQISAENTATRLLLENMRQEITASLNEIHDFASIAAYAQYLEPLTRCYEQANRMGLDSDIKEIKTVTRTLEVGLFRDAFHDLVTGLARKNALTVNSPRHLTMLQQACPDNRINSIRLNALLGFMLGQTAMNPIIFRSTADYYIKHVQRFFAVYAQQSDASLFDAIQSLESQQAALDDIDLSPQLERYYEALRAVRSHQTHCIQKFNEIQRGYLQTKYDKIHGDSIVTASTLNFLESPHALKDIFFKKGSLASVVNADKEFLAQFSDGKTFKLELAKIYKAFKHTALESYHLPAEDLQKWALLLTAQYLGIIQFQLSSPAMGFPKIPTERSLNRDGAGENADVRAILLDETGEADGIRFLTNPDEGWTLNIGLSVLDTPGDGITFHFSGNYHKLCKAPKGSYFPQPDTYLETSTLSGKYSDPGGKGGFFQFFRREIPRYIEAQLKENAFECRVDRIQAGHTAERINHSFIDKRQSLARWLIHFEEAGMAEAERDILAYKQALLALDIAALELKLSAHLARKKLNDGVRLIDSQELKTEMLAASSNSSTEPNGLLATIELTPSLKLAIDALDLQANIQARHETTELTAPEETLLAQLPTLDCFEALTEAALQNHPWQVMQFALTALRAHALWRNQIRLSAPWLVYVDLQAYMNHKILQEIGFFREEAYQYFEESKKRKFKRACHRIDHPTRREMDRTDYKEAYDAVHMLGLEDAKEPTATGFKDAVDLKALDHTALSRGWECNIAQLLQIAKQWVPALFPPDMDVRQIVNFHYWKDGAIYFAKLIDYDGGLSLGLAQEVPITKQNYTSVLTNFIEAGGLLHTAVGHIALSEQLFQKAFDVYRDAIQKVQETSTRLNHEPTAVLNAITADKTGEDASIYGGLIKSIGDHIDLHRTLLINYIAMAFGENASQHLKNTDSLKEALSAGLTQQPAVTFTETLRQVLAGIDNLRNRILARVDSAKLLAFFGSQLHHYFDTDESNTLVITPHLLSRPAQPYFSLAHIELIDEFLSAYPHITRLSFMDIPFGSAAESETLLNAIVAVTRKHGITDIRISNADLRMRHLALLNPLLQEMRIVDLSHNRLNYEGEKHPTDGWIQWVQTLQNEDLMLSLQDCGLSEAEVMGITGALLIKTEGSLRVNLTDNACTETCLRSISTSFSTEDQNGLSDLSWEAYTETSTGRTASDFIPSPRFGHPAIRTLLQLLYCRLLILQEFTSSPSASQTIRHTHHRAGLFNHSISRDTLEDSTPTSPSMRM